MPTSPPQTIGPAPTLSNLVADIKNPCADNCEIHWINFISEINPYLKKVCRRYLHSNDLIDEAVQESQISIFKNLHRFELRSERELIGWLGKIAYHASLKVQRSERRIRHHERNAALLHEEESQHHEQSEPDALLLRRLKIAIDGLTERQRTVITLRYFQKLDYAIIADQLNISQTTARNISNQTLLRLKQRLRHSTTSLVILAWWSMSEAHAQASPPAAHTDPIQSRRPNRRHRYTLLLFLGLATLCLLAHGTQKTLHNQHGSAAQLQQHPQPQPIVSHRQGKVAYHNRTTPIRKNQNIIGNTWITTAAHHSTLKVADRHGLAIRLNEAGKMRWQAAQHWHLKHGSVLIKTSSTNTPTLKIASTGYTIACNQGTFRIASNGTTTRIDIDDGYAYLRRQGQCLQRLDQHEAWIIHPDNGITASIYDPNEFCHRAQCRFYRQAIKNYLQGRKTINGQLLQRSRHWPTAQASFSKNTKNEHQWQVHGKLLSYTNLHNKTLSASPSIDYEVPKDISAISFDLKYTLRAGTRKIGQSGFSLSTYHAVLTQTGIPAVDTLWDDKPPFDLNFNQEYYASYTSIRVGREHDGTPISELKLHYKQQNVSVCQLYKAGESHPCQHHSPVVGFLLPRNVQISWRPLTCHYK